MRCAQCGKSNGTVQETWICDPGGAPIKAWLHRECEAAFLQQLAPNWDFIVADMRQRGLIQHTISWSSDQRAQGFDERRTHPRTQHEERYRPASGNLRFRAPNARSAEG